MPQVKQNERNQLHNVNGPSVEWRDGWNQFFINGRSIPDRIFYSVFNEEYTPEDFFKEPQEEIKSAVIVLIQEKFGEEYLFNFLRQNLKEIDTYVDKKSSEYLKGTTGGMNIGVYTLFKGKINNENIAYVRCYCPSTDRMFFLGVNPSHNNAKDAIASLYRVPKDLVNNIQYIQRQGERFSTVFDEEGTDLLRTGKVNCNETTTITGDRYFSLMKYEY